jgi:hypothetical protein
MSAVENPGDGSWSVSLTRVVMAVTTLCSLAGIAFAFLFTSLAPIFSGIQLGVWLSILYVLYKIAQELHHLRLAS